MFPIGTYFLYLPGVYSLMKAYSEKFIKGKQNDFELIKQEKKISFSIK